MIEPEREYCLQFDSKYGKNLEDKLQVKANTKGTKACCKSQALQKATVMGKNWSLKADRDLMGTGGNKSHSWKLSDLFSGHCREKHQQ